MIPNDQTNHDKPPLDTTTIGWFMALDEASIEILWVIS